MEQLVEEEEGNIHQMATFVLLQMEATMEQLVMEIAEWEEAEIGQQ
jgi:hypothetical protein